MAYSLRIQSVAVECIKQQEFGEAALTLCSQSRKQNERSACAQLTVLYSV